MGKPWCWMNISLLYFTSQATIGHCSVQFILIKQSCSKWLDWWFFISLKTIWLVYGIWWTEALSKILISLHSDFSLVFLVLKLSSHFLAKDPFSPLLSTVRICFNISVFNVSIRLSSRLPPSLSTSNWEHLNERFHNFYSPTPQCLIALKVVNNASENI